MKASLTAADVAYGEPVAVRAAQTLAIGSISWRGSAHLSRRAWRLRRAGDLGSRAVFGSVLFGGHATGSLKAGRCAAHRRRIAGVCAPRRAADSEAARADIRVQIGVVYGRMARRTSSSYEDIETAVAASYEVHFNQRAHCVRLIGPKPRWARADGGEAGLASVEYP